MKKLTAKSLIFIFAIAISLCCVLLWNRINTKPTSSVESPSPEELTVSHLPELDVIQKRSNSDICIEIDEWNKNYGVIKTPTKKTINGGVLNGKACLAEPEFPKDIQQAKDLDNKVLVEVLVNEYGKVVTAKAIKGNAIYYKAAEKAAIKSRFEQFFLRGEPIRVNGTLVYDFANPNF